MTVAPVLEDGGGLTTVLTLLTFHGAGRGPSLLTEVFTGESNHY